MYFLHARVYVCPCRLRNLENVEDVEKWNIALLPENYVTGAQRFVSLHLHGHGLNMHSTFQEVY